MHLVPPTDPVLWTKAEPVADVDAIQPAALQMLALLPKLKGIALSATQVGIPLRFFVWHVSSVVINPVIHLRSGGQTHLYEGCLSFPGLGAPVARWSIITCSWIDHLKVAHVRQITGMPARIFQHEIDHLDGVCVFPRPKSPYRS